MINFGQIILDRLSSRIIEYIGNDLQLNVQNIGISETVNEIQFLDQTACILLENQNNGIISLSTSYKLSHLILKNFINLDILNDEINEYAQASLEETLNITLGNIIKEIPSQYGEIFISPPFIFKSQPIIYANKFEKMYSRKILIENEILLISYFKEI